jgi:hypothetical protein
LVQALGGISRAIFADILENFEIPVEMGSTVYITEVKVETVAAPVVDSSRKLF